VDHGEKNGIPLRKIVSRKLTVEGLAVLFFSKIQNCTGQMVEKLLLFLQEKDNR